MFTILFYLRSYCTTFNEYYSEERNWGELFERAFALSNNQDCLVQQNCRLTIQNNSFTPLDLDKHNENKRKDEVWEDLKPTQSDTIQGKKQKTNDSTLVHPQSSKNSYIFNQVKPRNEEFLQINNNDYSLNQSNKTLPYQNYNEQEQSKFLKTIINFPGEVSLTYIKQQNKKFFNEFLEKLTTFKIPPIFYYVFMNEIVLKYNYYVKNKIASYDKWNKQASQELKCNCLHYPGYIYIEFLKENIKLIWGNKIEKTYLCFQKAQTFENINPSNILFLKAIINTNENLIYYFVVLLQIVDLNEYSAYTKENIKNLLCFNWSIFPESILPEFYFLKNVLANKIDQSSIDVSKVHFMVRFFIYKSLSAFKKIIVLFSLKNFNPSSCFNVFYVHLYVNEMVQLRSLLIILCNELGLVEISKILHFLTNFHINFTLIGTPSDLEKKLFWVMYGNILTCSQFNSFKEWHSNLKKDLQNFSDNFYQPNTVNTNNFSLAQKLTQLRYKYLSAFFNKTQDTLLKKEPYYFVNIIRDTQIIINLRLQYVIFCAKNSTKKKNK